MASKLDRSPDASLRRIGTTTRTVVARILRTFDRATSADVEAGARWYVEAGELATELAGRSAYSREECAAVIAHLSPRTTWTRNVTGAVELITHGERATGILTANFDRASNMLESGYDDPLDSLNGPKTRAFYANILGDHEAVTVDVWAAQIAGVTESELDRAGVYDAVAHCYRLAARRRGVDPDTMQATTWIVARGGRAS